MARKKKKNSYKPDITKFGEYRYKQKVFVNRYPDGKLGYGTIEYFHLNSPSDGKDYVSFACEMCGQFRLASVDEIIKSPTKSHHARLKAAKKKRDC